MAIPCAPPPCGANDKQTYRKKTEKPRDSAEKSVPAPRLFHCEYFQNAARLILTTSPPFPPDGFSPVLLAAGEAL